MQIVPPEPQTATTIKQVRAGFIPLLDCAPLVIARELDLDRACGFRLLLHREASWANIRDKVDVGSLDCAHMLAPMPLAMTLGLGRATDPVIVPLSLNLNGNAITVSLALYDEMLEVDPVSATRTGMPPAKALATVVRKRRQEGREPLVLGMVFPFSSHNYDLRYWLSEADIDPDADVNLIVIPPPLLSESLRTGRVDGFCVGEPWNSVAATSGHGRIVATKSQLWPRSPEKVLGVRQRWAAHNPELTMALVRALVLASRWLGDPSNWPDAARILALPQYVAVPADILLASFAGSIPARPGRPPWRDEEMIIFHGKAANFPWRSHALWLLAQMIRWGQVRQPFELVAVADRVYRPDLFRESVAGLGLDVPASDYKGEGTIVGATHFGAHSFDPREIMDYLRGLKVRSAAVDLERFAAMNH